MKKIILQKCSWYKKIIRNEEKSYFNYCLYVISRLEADSIEIIIQISINSVLYFDKTHLLDFSFLYYCQIIWLSISLIFFYSYFTIYLSQLIYLYFQSHLRFLKEKISFFYCINFCQAIYTTIIRILFSKIKYRIFSWSNLELKKSFDFLFNKYINWFGQQSLFLFIFIICKILFHLSIQRWSEISIFFVFLQFIFNESLFYLLLSSSYNQIIIIIVEKIISIIRN